jgi:hypothetical protein
MQNAAKAIEMKAVFVQKFERTFNGHKLGNLWLIGQR